MSAFLSTEWAIIPDRLPAIRAVLARWESGVKLSQEEIAAAVGSAPMEAAARRAQSGPRSIGVLPILGVMAQRTAGDVSSAGTATDTIRRQFSIMMNDDSIGAIVLDVDSPGGSVFGVQELAADIFAARGHKKVVAVANSLMASAAYWVGTAAEEVVVSPGGEVGSIGVITAHEDHSGEMERDGIRVEVLTAGKYKGEGHPFGPLSDETRAHIQSRLDERYSEFVGAVARHRGVDASEVRGGFGEGRTVSAAQARALGMVDRIETLEQTFARLVSSPRAQSPRRAAMAHRISLLEVEG